MKGKSKVKGLQDEQDKGRMKPLSTAADKQDKAFWEGRRITLTLPSP
jgi:hypothetical protein